MMPEPHLTRRPDLHRKDCWRIYFGDVHVGDIGPRAGGQTNADHGNGIAASFQQRAGAKGEEVRSKWNLRNFSPNTIVAAKR